MAITNRDRAVLDYYLQDNGYGSVEDWAREDGRYVHSEQAAEWFDGPGPWAKAVDLEQECFSEIERLGEAQDEQRYGFF